MTKRSQDVLEAEIAAELARRGAEPVELGAPMIEAPAARENVGQIMREATKGSGRSGSRSTRKRKRVPKSSPRPEKKWDETAPLSALRFRVRGLAVEEHAFWDTEEALVARRELRRAIAHVRAGVDGHIFVRGLAKQMRTTSRRTRPLPEKAGRVFQVYGLTEDEIALLREHPGLAREILAGYARTMLNRRR